MPTVLRGHVITEQMRPQPRSMATQSRGHGTQRQFEFFHTLRSYPSFRRMDLTVFLELYVFILAGFVGYQVITKVPALLHTPLMSATNAISGISLVGSLVAAGGDQRDVEPRCWAFWRSRQPRSTWSAVS